MAVSSSAEISQYDGATRADDDQRNGASDRADYRRATGGVMAERLPLVQQPILGGFGGIDYSLYGTHSIGGDVRFYDPLSGNETFGTPRIDRAFQLVELDFELLLQHGPTALLFRIITGKLLQLGKGLGYRLYAFLVRLEVSRIAGNEEPTLATLRVLHGSFERLGRGNYLDRMLDEFLALPELRDVSRELIHLCADNQECRDCEQREARPQGV